MPHSDFSGLIGIDLGTTFSCMARLTKDGEPVTIPNREGDRITPSVLLVENELVIIGKEAKRSECLAPDKTAVCVKRDMGEKSYSHSLGGRAFRPEVLSAFILKRLKNDAENRVGPVTRAVITVPAYFDDTRRKATQDAGKIAGLNVIDIINEPTAAALAFAFDRHIRKHSDAKSFANEMQHGETTVLVYDLGGGTFDVSLVRMSPDKFETLATDGDVRLGGRDWDQKLVDYAADQFLNAHGSDPREDAESRAFLYQAAEQAKHALSVRPATKMMVLHAATRMSVEITREQFEEITDSLLTRTEMTTDLVVESAGLTWNEVDRILLVGGMTRCPQVREMLSRLSGKEPDASLSADEVVAHGAAIHGGMLMARQHAGDFPDVSQRWANFQTVDVNSHSLGVAVRASAGYANSILIPKNTQLPITKSKVYQTSSANQRQVRVRILEGEALEAEACVQIGELLISNLPPNLPPRSPIEVQVSYGTDGRISVVGRDLTSGRLVETLIVREGGLTEEELGDEAQRIVGLEVG